MSVTDERREPVREVPRRAALHVVREGARPTLHARPLVRELEDLSELMHTDGPSARLRAELVSLLGAWAHALVELHRRSVTALTPRAELPWLLADGLPAWLDDLPAEAGPVWAVRAHPGVARALRSTLAGWSAVQRTHGEMTGNAVEIEHDGDTVRAALLGDGAHRVGVRGDPRWDVATVVDWLSVALEPVLDTDWGIDPAATFVARYRAHGGDALPSRHMAVARTLTTAVEWTAQLAVLQEPDDEELAWLAGLWGRPLALVLGAV